VREGDEEPDGPRNGEEDRGQEKAVVVPELGDCAGRGEGADCSTDFVEDMLNEIRWSDGLQEAVGI
jgi:hypothetical protein